MRYPIVQVLQPIVEFSERVSGKAHPLELLGFHGGKVQVCWWAIV